MEQLASDIVTYKKTKTKIRNAFNNNMSTDIKLSKLSKTF